MTHHQSTSHKRLFTHNDPYADDAAFLKCVRENIEHLRKTNTVYAKILDRASFDPQRDLADDTDESALHKIPVLTSLFFKRNDLLPATLDDTDINVTSSGTKGLQSRLAFDRESVKLGTRMMIKFMQYHKLISALPTNYIILGYEPTARNNAGAIKTAQGMTKFAPALHREYVMKAVGDDYVLNIEGIKNALIRYAKMPFPVRFIGFPSYLYHMVTILREHGIKLKLHCASRIFLGGGWKQFSSEAIDPEVLQSLVQETLGIPKSHIHEFFSAVEHPLPYLKCQYGHFHIPGYSRVIIRDVVTLEPVPPGNIGILSFVSPLVASMPLVSVATDDLAVYYSKHETPCPCGLDAHYFKWLSRAGVSQIKTCAADAAERIQEVKR